VSSELKPSCKGSIVSDPLVATGNVCVTQTSKRDASVHSIFFMTC